MLRRLLLGTVLVSCSEFKAVPEAPVDGGTDASTVVGAPPDLGDDAYGKAVRADGPRIWYRLDEAAGATALVDAQGGQGGTIESGVMLAAAPLITKGYALDLSGAGGSTLPDISFEGRRPFSIELWMKPLRVDTTFRRLFSHEFSVGDPAKWQGFNVSLGGGKLEFDRITDGVPCGPAMLEAGSLRNGAHHVVATYDGTSSQLFVDGALVDTRECASELRAQPPFAAFLGRADTGSSFEGTLDEAAFYDKALSPEAVARHFAAGHP